jgi:hypothetical protein
LSRLCRKNDAHCAAAGKYRCPYRSYRPASRLTVEQARPNRRAIDRNDSPAARPKPISSRSTKLNLDATTHPNEDHEEVLQPPIELAVRDQR